MTTSFEDFTAAHKANVDTFLDLTSKAFAGVEKLFELNMQAARATLTEGAEHAKAVLAVKDPQELVKLQTELTQPAAEKAMSYGRHVADITTTTQSELSKIAETQFADVQQKLGALVESAAKNAPAGSEGAVAMVKSSMAAATSAYETLQKTAQQALASATAAPAAASAK